MKFLVGVKKVPDAILFLLSLSAFTSLPSLQNSIDHLPEPTGAFVPYLIDLRSKPLSDELQSSVLFSLRLQLLDGGACPIQGNVVARHHCRGILGRHEIEQVTIAAGMGAVRVTVIKTRARVLEDGL